MKRIDIVAEVAGKVWKIEAQAGAQLAADESILILESMKMEIPVVAPLAGKLLELHVKEGDTVHEGDVVAAIAVVG
jgi:acetyl-CoA carboxylase biotin carboxyl carrier protein